MQNKDALGSRPADRSDWKNAWEVVARLAAARDASLQEIGQESGQESGHDQRAAAIQRAAILESASRLRTAPAPAAISAKHAVPIDPDQLARAVAEIESASAALRRSEPGLEAWRPGSAKRSAARKYLSVWILIGGIWISATLVVAGATGAILYVLG
jgi:hypothetical protein